MSQDRDARLLELETLELEHSEDDALVQSDPYRIGLQKRTITGNRQARVAELDRGRQQVVAQRVGLDENSEVLRDARGNPVENSGPYESHVHHGNSEQQESDDRNDCEKCASYESRPHGPHRRSSLPTPPFFIEAHREG